MTASTEAMGINSVIWLYCFVGMWFVSCLVGMTVDLGVCIGLFLVLRISLHKKWW